MNYKRIYDNFMDSRLQVKEERIQKRKLGEYFEAHHIIPKSMGGEGSIKKISHLSHPNVVLLTAREHYVAHLLLWVIYKTREMAFAFRSMCITDRYGKRGYKVSSRMYEDLRTHISKVGVSDEVKERLRKHNTGKKMSEEAKEKIRQARLGKKLSPEAKEKLRIYRTGRKMPPEAIEKTRQANLGRKRSPEHKEKVRQASLGKKHSPEYKEKMRQVHLGKTKSPESIAKRTETRKRNRVSKLVQMEGSGGQGE